MGKLGLLIMLATAFTTAVVGSDYLKTEEVVSPEVLSASDQNFPTPTPTPVPTPTPRASPLVTPKPRPTPVPAATSQQINEFIDRFAGQYNVDPNIIRHIALCESGFNPTAKNSLYGGLFQFSPHTWRSYRSRMHADPDPDLRFTAQEAVQTAAYALSVNQAYIWPHCVP